VSSALKGAMAKPRDNRQKDLLKPALEAIIDLGHPLGSGLNCTIK
jgi:hypothetical protein